MTEKSTIECPTPTCTTAREERGWVWVYENGAQERYGEDAVAFCERCGGWFDGTTWHHECQTCKIEVEPGKLTGLFVPHLCSPCEQKVADAEIAARQVCRFCHYPYSRCCC